MNRSNLPTCPRMAYVGIDDRAAGATAARLVRPGGSATAQATSSSMLVTRSALA